MTESEIEEEPSLGLSKLSIQDSYRSGDDPLSEFYVPALRESTHYDRAAGYFDSKSL